MLLEELRALKAQCVFVDGHSYNRAGNFGHEYLYSFMHYIEAAPAIRTMAREWVSGFGDICAVHLRWDEQECKGGKKGLVCMRVGIAGSGKGISWVEQTDVADAILNVGRGRPIYLASSPYVPEDVERDLRSLLAKKTRLVRKVDMKDHVVGNFVEREIAIVADVFIGEVGSTWSGTVYYKRRTLGKETVWGCRSLGVDCVLGYYVKTGKLQKPQWFEEREGRFMQTDRGIIPQRNKLRL